MRTFSMITSVFWINCTNFNEPNSFFMPRSILVICGMGILLNSTVSGQSQPQTSKQSQLINQQFLEQKTWQMKQLPKNSVLYQTAYKVPEYYVFTKSAPALTNYHQPVWTGVSTMPGSDLQTAQNNELNSLQHFIQQDRKQYMQYIKNSWWKDPSKGIGASLLQGIVNDRNPGRKL